MTPPNTLAQLAAHLLSGQIEVVDLSAVLGPNTPIIELPASMGKNTPKVEINTISAYDENGKDWAWSWLILGEHSGTHFDAPAHWRSGKDHPDGTTDTLDLRHCIGMVNVIDCSKETAENPDFLLTKAHVQAWEAEHGAIGAGEWVVMRTDWYKRNHSAKEFLNTDETGSHNPGPATDAVEYLVGKDVLGWGAETIGTDAGQGGKLTPPLPAHDLFHRANKFGLASLANLDKLPPRGAVMVASPLKIQNGSGSPIRAFALVQR